MTEPQSEGETRPVQTASALSRRSFLKGAGGAAAASGVLAARAGAAQETAESKGATTVSGATEIELTVNGQVRQVTVEPRTTLLSALRDRMEPALTGTKLVCDMGSCGACTVVVDGKPAYSCLTLAVQCQGKAVTTVEGFGSPEAMSDVQDAFCEKDGLMCGFCTPGFIVATHAALDRKPDATLDELKYELSGNFCRCGTYPHIFDAAQAVQASRARSGESQTSGDSQKEGGR
ncbi:Carbon monoxide dehydrogenase small chain [Planctomycetes bacterium Poly30]|uniref:Carbon monoxide dehydrogenase small chain n=1 Tax=Saltatorellus ferox TaxID=2528018 RepID=A0A518ETY6_9BACT|nr:Carbon monoxide dehydrogenase small chain [Planctomycetes bacterium Poly30]